VERRKLAIAVGVYPPDIGGPAKFAFEFSQWLASKGSQITVVSLTDNPSTKYLSEYENPQVILVSREQTLPSRFLATIKMVRNLARDHTFLVNGLFIEISLLTIFHTFKYVAKIPGDIVWERATNQGETKLSVIDYQGTETFGKRAMRKLFTRALNKAAFVILPSQQLKLLAMDWGVREENMVVLPNSTNLELFKAKPNTTKKFDLITVGRLIPLKGISELIEVSKYLNLSLAIVGGGPEELALKELARKLGASVSFLGEISPDGVVENLNASRLFVLNSSHEGSPHALIEAMSCGMTCIARENTGSVEIISNNINGLLYNSRDGLKEAISKALEDKDMALKLGKNAREDAIKRFSLESNFSKIESLMKAK
jgi:glycosyltransferase involved in cell wall biosynthesis